MYYFDRRYLPDLSTLQPGVDPSFIRQLPPHQHGPERMEERPPHTQHVDWASMFPNEIILHGPTNRKQVALTFDDGPDDVWTPKILDTLKQLNVKGTFMCVGQRVQQNPNVLQRMVREGHVIGNHTWSHPNLTKIPINEVKDQIERTANEVYRIAKVRPILFRPPYGALNIEVIRKIIQLKDKIIYWDVDSLDWAGLTGPQVAANILAHVRPGAIILQHCAGGRGESLRDTVEALPYVVQTLHQEGYQFLTVPQLVNIKPYH
ncbi:polysaccharide deacetylase family protein [Heyndrickxia acidicola]|uniref:Polysaccharide deacetylase family protein n=1 Tax=Heyndrickxia acidicola TaxID=209389 RepID=A0ABU6MG30_9BACI|nr:polysaccharide deacetylase family protein [Heyndrickxia acidicola]MED1203644.1 polysaccharide deacetylase family protein [Heyndrickxia acidicola]